MKKISLIVLATVITAVGASAQSSPAFNKGYRGNVMVGGDISVTKGWPVNSIDLTTSHGYGFGDGMYIGGGVGIEVDLSILDASIPIFVDFKYNIIDWKLSPYVDCRMGVEFTTYNNLGTAFIASPGIGFDYRKISLRVGYKCKAGASDEAYGYKINTISLSAAINF